MKFLVLVILIFTSTQGFAFDHQHKKWGGVLSNYLVSKGVQTLFHYKLLPHARRQNPRQTQPSERGAFS